MNGEHAAAFGPVTFEALTSFFCFEIVAKGGGLAAARRFVLNVPLQNAPEDRHERVLRSILNSSEKLLRLILFLLAEGGAVDAASTVGKMLSGDRAGAAEAPGPGFSLPLFEQMVRALARNPSSLDRIDSLVSNLRATEESIGLMPEGWDAIWEPIMAARRKVKSG